MYSKMVLDIKMKFEIPVFNIASNLLSDPLIENLDLLEPFVKHPQISCPYQNDFWQEQFNCSFYCRSRY